ncbi:6-phosphogluconate dehydrogenase, NADP(+)-dependent, decarboxylating [Acidithiobacillus ferridurans]|uniref:6-phosphogluconate dehydrogenase, NADP(+)-dependent, decarboxylating n=1 Tax=Acidithiobacillus ferridurans TaxID=1232575 RepID=A0A2Z6IP54_ACIFI|nr:NAD(P)-binding domain-containing protein [Acidithiobacillus ferridurans]BBF66793.1 6-phosphogluconate dehydrogenase, NADP(+)-dependent, decarboxylating [Acidithiobacillus ferridurans]
MGNKDIGMVGLGRMGANMARRLHLKGMKVTAYNRHTEKATELAKETGMRAASSLEALVQALPTPGSSGSCFPPERSPRATSIPFFPC